MMGLFSLSAFHYVFYGPFTTGFPWTLQNKRSLNNHHKFLTKCDEAGFVQTLRPGLSLYLMVG